jgi:hypothetical protein
MERITVRIPDGVQIQREASWVAFALTWIVTAALLTVAALHHDLADGGFLADRNLPVRVASPAKALAVIAPRAAWASERVPTASVSVAVAPRIDGAQAVTRQSSKVDVKLVTEPKASSLTDQIERMEERDLARVAMLMALLHPAGARAR